MSTRRNQLLLLVGMILIASSLACVLGVMPEAASPPPAAEEPVEEEPVEEEAAADVLPTPTLTAAVLEPQPAIPESRRLTLEFPPVIRTGDSTRIRMTLKMNDQGDVTPTAEVEGNVVTGEVVEIPNLYETHLVVAEARLDMAGVEIRPPGTISEPLTPGNSVTFYWSVRPEESGRYEGTAWLHLRFIPISTLNGEQESRIAVSIQFLEIEAKSFMGLFSGGTARGVGAIGSVIGTVLGFPFFDDVLRFLLRRLRFKRRE